MQAESKQKRLLVVQVAGLGLQLASQDATIRQALPGLTVNALHPPFPALTCSAQATFRTATNPASHGVVANGWLDRVAHRATFWEQSADWVSGARIWQGLRERGGHVALLFWQQSLGEAADIILSPAPIHLHSGGMVQSCYSLPTPLYDTLTTDLGSAFNLRHYWGPCASTRGSRWIARATARVISGEVGTAPDLCLTYLPALDYDLQRYGPNHPKAQRALQDLVSDLSILHAAAQQHGYDLLVWSDYAIRPATEGALYPNRLLHDAGWMQTRVVRGRHYPDLHASRAFAVVDHQIAHIYLRALSDLEPVRALLGACGDIRPRADWPGLDHDRAGDLVLAAPAGRWLAYPWWTHPREAPDYASHVDIHNKPGYDPGELFWGWPPGSISMNLSRIRGVHGLVEAGNEACWMSNILPPRTHTLQSLAEATRLHLETLK